MMNFNDFMAEINTGKRRDFNNPVWNKKACYCNECGNAVSLNELEIWTCYFGKDFDDSDITCTECYEEMMGEDL